MTLVITPPRGRRTLKGGSHEYGTKGVVPPRGVGRAGEFRPGHRPRCGRRRPAQGVCRAEELAIAEHRRRPVAHGRGAEGTGRVEEPARTLPVLHAGDGRRAEGVGRAEEPAGAGPDPYAGDGTGPEGTG